MEKLGVNKTFISAEKINNYVSSVKKDLYCQEFIQNYHLNIQDIEDNLVTFNHVISDHKLCHNCQGLSQCKKGISGLTKILEYIDGKVIETLVPCKYLEKKNRISENYLLRDFEDKYLELRLKPEDVDGFREGLVEKMGLIKSEKQKQGLYIFGNKGVGKSYLSICFANRFVEEGKSVAYIDAKQTISLLRGLVINNKEEYTSIINKLKTAELLVIDDLGNEKITDWSRDSVLYEVLDYRLRNKLTKIFILSNYNLNELKAFYNVDNEARANRFVELIKSICECKELVGVNRFL